MIRTQVQLTAMQVRALKAMAAERDVSISQLVREGVDLVVATLPETAHQRALTVVGRYPSDDGRNDVARGHDNHLDTIFADE
ncbi:MAG: CopG family transcriptional regulator [Egibacteraceae bacterium]